MCRLFAYVQAPSPLSTRDALGPGTLDEFAELAAVHKHGWGAATVVDGGRSFHLSTEGLAADRGAFDALAAKPLTSAIIHERLASPGIARILDNQQPFVDRGIAFAHNGTVGNAEGNIVNRSPAYRESLGLAGSVTMSDSKLYAELFMKYLADAARDRNGDLRSPSLEDLRGALSSAIAVLRRDYPDSSFNNVVQTPDYTLVTRAHAAEPRHSELLRRVYEGAGWARWLETYYEIRYAALPRPDGSVTCVASSSGYPASEAWRVLENDRVIAFAHETGEARVLSLN